MTGNVRCVPARPDETDDGVGCICIPTLDIPYNFGCCHLIHADLQRQFFDHFNSIRTERDSPGKRKKVHGRCAFCQKEVATNTDLAGYLTDANVKALIRHTNLEHSASMALLVTSGKFSNVQ